MIDTFGKLWDLLDRRERRNALLLLGMTLIQGLVEAAGVASILPFMAVLANPQLIYSNRYLAAVYGTLGFGDSTSFLIFLGVVALLAILTRIVVSALTNYATVRYFNLRHFTLSIRLLQSYLSRPYGWFLNRHSADMGKTVLSEVDEVVVYGLTKAFSLVANVIVTGCLIALVVIVEPRVAITATLIIGGAYAVVYLCFRAYMGRLSRERFAANRQRFQLAQEMLSGIKEVKIRGLEYPYLRRFSEVARRLAHQRARAAVLGQMPRFVLEAVAMVGIMTTVLVFLISTKEDPSKVFPLLVLYALAGQRALPKMQSIYANLTSLRFGGAAIDAVHTDMAKSHSLTLVDTRSRKPLPLQHCLELRGITFAYPGADHATLADISLKIPARTTVGFVGSTGAGKTTLVDVILGLLEPQQGEVRVDGTLITAETVRDWQQTIGYVPQHIFLADDTVASNIAFGIPPHKIDMQAVERVSRMAELHEFITQELPNHYATMVGERGVRLSGGERQRIGIARALYHDPDVVVLDEATSALDNLTERAVMDAIRNLAHRKTILIIAHRLSTVRACDGLFLLENGRLKTAGTYDELLNADSTFRDMASTLQLRT